MPGLNPIKSFPIKSMALSISAAWTVLILISAIWNINQHNKEINSVIMQIGRSSIERDKLYRLWNARHGGIYVPVTAENPPNPYLTSEMAPRRDLNAAPDLTLTMVNPAYMTRQVYELAREQKAVSGHITSRHPINPRNKADAWEEKALKAVDQDLNEYSEFVNQDGQEYLRMLHPLRVDKACLKCHAAQGYKEGDLRGGISVTLALTSYHNSAGLAHQSVVGAHFLLWAIGLGLTFLGYIALAREDTARQAAEKQILKLAHFDKLTGLVNRNLFEDRAAQAIAMANRQGKKVALLYVDLDHFKPINDTFGHEAGDAVLQEVAARLKATVRESDTIARIGGDEFVIVMQNIRDRQEAAPLARKIISSVGKPFLTRGGDSSISASIGISCYPEDGTDLHATLKKADAAMYLAKKRGGADFEFC